MKIGTKSILFGAHQFILHPVFVAIAWIKLYGFPCDLRIWLAFVVHDIGYFGKSDMDGKEGETHVEFGANLMGKAFGVKWKKFCLFHSRFYAKKYGELYSRLCVADKYSIVLTPAWLYCLLTSLTGEIEEYMEKSIQRGKAGKSKYSSMNVYNSEKKIWFLNVKEYLKKWVDEHKDLKEDTWTPDVIEDEE